MTKKEMRKSALDAVSRIGEAERSDFSSRIARRVLALPEYARAESVFCFAGTRYEPDTLKLIGRMIADGKRVYLPVPREKGHMYAVRLLSPGDLRGGRYGILEPPDGEVAGPGDIGLILVPGAAFDREGGRLGRGAGFYDRYLEKARAPAVGLAFEAQLVDAVPREAHDLPVRWVVTERYVYGKDGDR